MNALFGFSNALTNRLPADLSVREFILFLGVPALMY